MNDKLVEAYLEGILKKWINYSDTTMYCNVNCPTSYALTVIDC
jgi:hypothetical protein